METSMHRQTSQQKRKQANSTQGKQTCNQAGIQTDRHTDIQTYRQVDSDRHSARQSSKEINLRLILAASSAQTRTWGSCAGYIVLDTQLIIGGKNKSMQIGIDDYCLATCWDFTEIPCLFMSCSCVMHWSLSQNETSASPFSTLVVQPTANNNMRVISRRCWCCMWKRLQLTLAQMPDLLWLRLLWIFTWTSSSFSCSYFNCLGTDETDVAGMLFPQLKKSTTICSPSRCCILQCN